LNRFETWSLSFPVDVVDESSVVAMLLGVL
jgi:hypothetical protein